MVQYDFEESINNADGAGEGYENFNGHVDGYDANHNYRHRDYDNDWHQIAESTLPLNTSKFAPVRDANNNNTNGLNGKHQSSLVCNSFNTDYLLQASIEQRSKQISKQLIIVNLISLLINLSLAAAAFYFAFSNDSPSTSAFAADCVLDFISSAIVLWRYHGDLNSVFMHAREQIACIYLGALFEISALAIIIKASSDMVAASSNRSLLLEAECSNELVYLAIAATLACSLMTIFKCGLYKTIRDKSILLDVVNTLISTIFAVSIVMSQVLINVNPSFWYLDPILSIVLALFMAGFGLKVIHQNFDILKPTFGHGTNGNDNHFNDKSCQSFVADKPQQQQALVDQLAKNHYGTNDKTTTPETKANYNTNLNLSIENCRLGNAANNWQKTNYSTISFV